MVQGLLQLLLFQALGELLSWFALPFIPGPVIGLILLLMFFVVRAEVPRDMLQTGQGILQHLGLLFVPASVGVVLYLPVLRANALAIGTALAASVVLTIGVTAGVLRLLHRDDGVSDNANESDAH